MPPVGFEPKISAGERAQTYALDLAATGTGSKQVTIPKYKQLLPDFAFDKPF
jgi:hypothetical protein